MADNVIISRVSGTFGNHVVFSDYSNAAITAATAKQEWIIWDHMTIVDVIADSETANSGEANDVLDVNINGTTIYTDQDHRPFLTQSNTGLFAEALEPDILDLFPGDVLSYDVDSIATTGSARFKISIICRLR